MTALWFAFAALTLPGAVDGEAPSAPSDLMALSSTVAREREVVEALAADVETARAAARAELLSLEQRERDLRAELDTAVVRTRALDEELKRLRSVASEGKTVHAEEDAAVARAIAEARVLLSRGVPFDVDARAARLNGAASALATFGAGAAAPLVWEHLERERELAENVGRGRQPVVVDKDGQPTRIMADTLHVGLVLLYFKTGGGIVGAAVRDGDAWRTVPAPSAEARAQILALFEATRNGAAQGTFLVPNTLAPIGGAR